jgi:hypothetical protein
MSTIYEIYVHGEFFEAWEETQDAYNRTVKLQDVYGAEFVHIEEKLSLSDVE